MFKRGSGVLLHITSLPSSFGIGDFGPCAYNFVDFLARTKQTYWQVLPLTVTDSAGGNAPYNSISAFAGNTLFISPELLQRENLLDNFSIKQFPKDYCNYLEVEKYKKELFSSAYNKFKEIKIFYDEYNEFCMRNVYWLDDFALFKIIRKCFNNQSWNTWPIELRDRYENHIQIVKKEYFDEIEKEKFLQFIFYRQWTSLRKYCKDKNIQIIGDIPIYISYDSVDVWKKPDFFKLDENKIPLKVSGVPPDYFSNTGQLWGNPIYNWDVLKKDGFKWWLKRIEHNLDLFDILRIDHFRGLVSFWEIPFGEKTAINGIWVKAPIDDLFNVFYTCLKHTPFIAEDLGFITDDVREAVRKFKLPGMKVLLFAFGEDNNKNPYLPHTYESNSVVYTGTHDINTVLGWYKNEATEENKKRVKKYIGHDIDIDKINFEFIRLAFMSVADIAIIPIQDIIGLGEEARMNVPSTTQDNWKWRLNPLLLSEDTAEYLLEITQVYGRC
ncbi:MAG: 4-alpha-glucanotransferase [Candidatus Firestonebacteria bacterium]|nr:4-alpha-glucanotransferase [Candidatus Firestonebacteria bacterium]